MQKIVPNLWFLDNPEPAIEFYKTVFGEVKENTSMRYDAESAKVSGKKEGEILVADFEIFGYRFTAINGGPQFQLNPSISFFVTCKTAEETEKLYKGLAEEGTPLMELGEYPFSPKFGWVNDKFGVSWQIFTGESEQKITPMLMFTQSHAGEAMDAMNFYTSLFPNSKIKSTVHYEEGEGDKTEYIKHAVFSLNGEKFMAMDSGLGHQFTFSEGVSLLVNCQDQKEVDRLWEKMTEGGEAVQCGWLKDKFGVSWQIIPKDMGKYVGGPDSEGSKRAMAAMLEMKKIDLQELKSAYENK